MSEETIKLHNANDYQAPIKVNGDTVFLPPKSSHVFPASAVSTAGLPAGVRVVKAITPTPR